MPTLNEYDMYLEKMVQTKLLNLQRSLNGEKEFVTKMYFNNDEFINNSISNDNAFELISSIQYSFDCSLNKFTKRN